MDSKHRSSALWLATYPYNVILGTVTVGVGLYFIRRYFAGGVCKSRALINGKTVIITGANTGIGKETAIDLAGRNARVILACRSVEKGEKAAVEVREKSKNDNVIFQQLDLASLASVRQFATKILKQEPRIDILINNAGVAIATGPYPKTEDGFEMQFGVNHLGHFLLTNLLLDRLKEAPSGRILTLTSRVIHYASAKIHFHDINSERSYERFEIYAQSKVANVLFTRALANRLEGTDATVTANAVDPGLVYTDLMRHMINPAVLVSGSYYCYPHINNYSALVIIQNCSLHLKKKMFQ